MAKKKKKGKDPAFLLYSGDFLAGTYTMNYEQKGKYITLMCIHHQKGFLTDIDLQSVLVDTDIVVASKFYKADDGKYYNQKMVDVITERKEYTKNRLANFSKNKDKDIDMDSHMDSHMEHHTGDEVENQDIKRKLLQVYNTPEQEEIKINEVSNTEINDVVYTQQMIDNMIEKFADKIDSRFKLNNFMIELEEDWGGWDNFLEIAWGNENSIKNNFNNKLSQYRNGIFK